MDPVELMLLAAISYRGCEFNLSNPHSRKIVYDEIARCLEIFSATHGRWQLAWGPAGHRPGTAGTDESAMYVVRRAGESPSSTVAIVIRGTNFFSFGDWLSNTSIDPKPWVYGDGGEAVKISQSMWSGLRILQRLKSGPVPPLEGEETAQEKQEAANTAAEAALAFKLLQRILQGPTTDLESATQLAKIIERISAFAVDPFASSPADSLRDVETAEPQNAGTLIDFLKTFVADAKKPVDIYVTGHSKGGGLAPVLALWLADTRSAPPEQWDPDNKANLHVCSFAAPTAGNAGFASHFQSQILRANVYRLANPYDIVPHAWDPDEIRQIPDLYDGQLRALKIPADVLARALIRSGYQHEAPTVGWNGTAVVQANCLKRAGVEHLDFYLKELGIYDEHTMSTLALFAPISKPRQISNYPKLRG